MAIGDEFNPDSIFAFQFVEFCDQVGISKKLLSQQLKKMLSKITFALENIDLPRNVNTSEELEFWTKLKLSISMKIEHFSQVQPEILNIDY